MKPGIIAAVFFVVACAHAETLPFDSDWQFIKGDTNGAWRAVNLPHDWSIEGPFAETNLTGGAGAFLPSGIAWYRKTFTAPSDHRVFIEFDGVMANSDVWINGHLLGHRPYGYVSFAYELTDYLTGTNVLTVRTDTSQQPASRWYTGAGIYRHAHLIVVEPVHFELWSTFVTTPSQNVVRVQNTVTNQSTAARTISVQATLVAPDGKLTLSESTPQTIAPGKSVKFIQELPVDHPQLWDLDHPQLCRLVSRVREDRVTLDEESTPFGIREARFDSATGFWLNGKNIKLKGVCLHHDGSAFGAAVPLGVWEYRLRELRKLGVNAIRTAHNPPAPEFLDLCDRMGFLVMDEMFDCWTVAKNPYDYHLDFNEWAQTDTRDTVRRDRNHPSIILYSAGNEIHDTPNAVLAKRILTGLVAVFHANDPTRPVTQALFRPNVSHDYDNGLADLLDVIGTNYRDNELLDAWRAKPGRKIVGTEQRRERETLLHARDNPQHAGQFLWTGVDYLGESRRWPTIGSSSGLLDRTGVPRPQGYEYQSWWSDKPMVFITRRTSPAQTAPDDPGFVPLNRRQVLFADWTPTNSAPHAENVEVYSNAEQVELFLNGKSLGTKQINADASPRKWSVAFAPGTLKAVAKNAGREVATHELRTAGQPARIVLTTDRTKLTTDWDSVAYVTATVVDNEGVVVPGANDLITFKIQGSGKIVVVDSADNASHESFQASERHAYQGRCVAILKATAPTGRLTLTASAPGLTAGTTTLEAAGVP